MNFYFLAANYLLILTSIDNIDFKRFYFHWARILVRRKRSFNMNQRLKIGLIGVALIMLCFSLFALPSLAQTNPLQLMVTEEGGKATSLKDLSAGKELMVVLILGADCPLSKKALTEAAE
ncbi:MAG: hypothetical protein WCH40_02820, partial [Verrucomicrobiales bacterium]